MVAITKACSALSLFGGEDARSTKYGPYKFPVTRQWNSRTAKDRDRPANEKETSKLVH